MSRIKSLSIAENWISAVDLQDSQKLKSLLADNFILYPLHQESLISDFEEICQFYRCIATPILGLKYDRIWSSEKDVAIEFSITIENKTLHGVELLAFNSDGEITRCDMTARTPASIDLLKKHLDKKLTQKPTISAVS